MLYPEYLCAGIRVCSYECVHMHTLVVTRYNFQFIDQSRNIRSWLCSDGMLALSTCRRRRRLQPTPMHLIASHVMDWTGARRAEQSSAFVPLSAVRSRAFVFSCLCPAPHSWFLYLPIPLIPISFHLFVVRLLLLFHLLLLLNPLPSYTIY